MEVDYKEQKIIANNWFKTETQAYKEQLEESIKNSKASMHSSISMILFYLRDIVENAKNKENAEEKLEDLLNKMPEQEKNAEEPPKPTSYIDGVPFSKHLNDYKENLEKVLEQAQILFEHELNKFAYYAEIVISRIDGIKEIKNKIDDIQYNVKIEQANAKKQ